MEGRTTDIFSSRMKVIANMKKSACYDEKLKRVAWEIKVRACYDEKLKVAGVEYPNSYKKLKLEKLHDHFLILRECYIDVIHSYHLQWIGPYVLCRMRWTL